MRIQTLFTITLLTAPSCGASFQQLQSRAAFDLECQPQAITAQVIDDETRIASGCGKNAVYVEHCTGNNHSGCTWMLNSPVHLTSVESK
jgi:hypothetical protein